MLTCFWFVGDPTVYGNLQPPSVAVESTSTGVQGGKSNGYGPCAGSVEAREAVAEYLSFDGVSYQAKDIILCSGCSSSLDLCITVLADPAKGHNIVVPNPGFPLYRTLSESLGVSYLRISTYITICKLSFYRFCDCPPPPLSFHDLYWVPRWVVLKT